MNFPAGANLSRMRACWIFPVRIDLPVCLRVLLENVLRRATSEQQAQAAARCIVDAGLAGEAGGEIAVHARSRPFSGLYRRPRIR